MSKARDTTFWLRLWIWAICIAMPSLTLVPFGGIWMWQHGYVLYWVIGACLFVIVAFLYQLYLFKKLDISPTFFFFFFFPPPPPPPPPPPKKKKKKKKKKTLRRWM